VLQARNRCTILYSCCIASAVVGGGRAPANYPQRPVVVQTATALTAPYYNKPHRPPHLDGSRIRLLHHRGPALRQLLLLCCAGRLLLHLLQLSCQLVDLGLLCHGRLRFLLRLVQRGLQVALLGLQHVRVLRAEGGGWWEGKCGRLLGARLNEEEASRGSPARGWGELHTKTASACCSAASHAPLALATAMTDGRRSNSPLTSTAEACAFSSTPARLAASACCCCAKSTARRASVSSAVSE